MVSHIGSFASIAPQNPVGSVQHRLQTIEVDAAAAAVEEDIPFQHGRIIAKFISGMLQKGAELDCIVRRDVIRATGTIQHPKKVSFIRKQPGRIRWSRVHSRTRTVEGL